MLRQQSCITNLIHTSTDTVYFPALEWIKLKSGAAKMLNSSKRWRRNLSPEAVVVRTREATEWPRFVVLRSKSRRLLPALESWAVVRTREATNQPKLFVLHHAKGTILIQTLTPHFQLQHKRYNLIVRRLDILSFTRPIFLDRRHARVNFDNIVAPHALKFTWQREKLNFSPLTRSRIYAPFCQHRDRGH